jgi:glutathione S-transferase
MSPPSHTTEVIYFDAAGRAEVTRIMLHAAGIPFTDTRIDGKDWPALKPTTPMGSIPLLKIDGISYTQSVPQMRYAARLADFYPSDPLEGLVIDEAMECLNELMAEAPKGGTDEELKEKRQAFQHGKMTQISKLLESRIQVSGHGKGFSKQPCVEDVGHTRKPCVADLALYMTVQSISGGDWTYIDANYFEQFPGITATCEMIADDEQVKAYYASLKK